MTKKKKPVKKTAKKTKETKLQQSKTPDFLEYIKNNNTMVDYMTKLRIMNPAAEIKKNLNEPRREGGFVRLAHARDEFTAPKLSKGKYANSKKGKKD